MSQNTVPMIFPTVFGVGNLEGFQYHEALFIQVAAVRPRFHNKFLSFQ